MKYLIILAFSVYAQTSSALKIWPDTTAPCNTTLQACVNGSADAETIEIRTNDVINETITSSDAHSLVAGIGYKPVFGFDRYIDITGTATDGVTVTVSGLTFLRGRISYTAFDFGGQNTTLNITNNHVSANLFNGHVIKINNQLNHNLELNIASNQFSFNFNPSGIIENGAIAITNGSNTGPSSSGTVTGRIYNNQIYSRHDNSVAIGLYEYAGNNSDLDVSSNEFTGGENASMYVYKDTSSVGNSRLDFAHNAAYSNQVDQFYRALKVEVAEGALEINAINNTVTEAFEAFSFQNSFGGIVDINLYNNLLANNQNTVSINNPGTVDTNPNITLNNDNNLFHNNDSTDPDFIVGSAHISADPKIKGSSDSRLLAGSPAIEAGNSVYLFLVGSVTLNDADGLFRIKNGNPGSAGVSLDIGAYEAGDMRILDLFSGNPSNTNTIDSTTINSQDFAKLQITHNWNPIIGSAVYNDINMGVYRAASIWRIFTQDQSQMATDVAFNVWNPAPSTNNFVHTATDATAVNESYTELDRSGLNDNPDAILSVTQLWEGVYNDNPTGVFYNNTLGRWYIYNSNLEDMPAMAQFNVYFQTPSSNAFEHRAGGANISGNYTYIDHPLLNDTSCAQFQITHKGISNYPYRTGVFYDSNVQQWAIFNQGGESMPDFARFHVIVSAEQIAACNDVIFNDDFE